MIAFGAGGGADTQARLIATELGRLDPENAATYTANAVAAIEELAALDAEVATILAPAQGKPIVTYHDAFGYFADHYGLNIIGSIAEGDAASPGAARVTELRGTIEAGEVMCLFPEAQHDPALVTQMTEGTGAKVGGALDPVGSSLEAGPGAYSALLTWFLHRLLPDILLSDRLESRPVIQLLGDEMMLFLYLFLDHWLQSK